MSESPCFSLGRFDAGQGSFTGVVCGGRIGAVTDTLSGWRDTGVEGLLPDWDDHVARLREAVSRDRAWMRWAEGQIRPLAPLRPRQLFGAGMNYRTHVVDLMVDEGVGSRPGMSCEEIRAEATAVMDERARSGTPLVFAGLPSSICGPDDDVQLRADSKRTDWELEL